MAPWAPAYDGPPRQETVWALAEPGRLLRFTRDGLMWSFVNDVADDRIGGLSWSRYITAENAEPTLHAIAARNCAAGG